MNIFFVNNETKSFNFDGLATLSCGKTPLIMKLPLNEMENIECAAA